MDETNDTTTDTGADELDPTDFETGDEQPESGSEPTDPEPEQKPTAKETPAEKARREVAEDEYEEFVRAQRFVSTFNETMEKDPKAFFAKMATFKPEVRAAMEEYLAEQYMQQIEDEKLTPEQRELRDLKAKFQAQEDEKKKAEEQATEAMVAAEQEALESTIMAAMEMTNVPRNPYVAKIALRGMEVAVKHGIEATPEMLAEYINSKVGAMFTNHLKGLDGESLMRTLGPDGMKALKQALSAKKGTPQGTFTKPGTKPQAPAPARPKTALEFLTKKEVKPESKSRPTTFDLLKRSSFAKDDDE